MTDKTDHREGSQRWKQNKRVGAVNKDEKSRQDTENTFKASSAGIERGVLAAA